MICQSKFQRPGHPGHHTGELCTYDAKYLVIAPAAPKVVCGHHARQFLKSALIPIHLFGRYVNIDQLPDINGFLDSLKSLGAGVSIEGPTISINFGGETHGKRAA